MLLFFVYCELLLKLFLKLMLVCFMFIEGIDFQGVSKLVLVSNTIQNVEIRTVSRVGIQPTRSFTVRLIPDTLFGAIHNMTHIYGTITIEIMDNSSMYSTSIIMG